MDIKEQEIIKPLKQILSKAYTEFKNNSNLKTPIKWIDIKILVSAINILSDTDEKLITDDINLEIKSTIDI